MSDFRCPVKIMQQKCQVLPVGKKVGPNEIQNLSCHVVELQFALVPDKQEWFYAQRGRKLRLGGLPVSLGSAVPPSEHVAEHSCPIWNVPGIGLLLATSLRKSESGVRRRLREPNVMRLSESMSSVSRRNPREPDAEQFPLSVSSFNISFSLLLKPFIRFLILSNERLLLIQVSFKRNLSSSRKDTIVSRMMSYQNDIF